MPAPPVIIATAWYIFKWECLFRHSHKLRLVALWFMFREPAERNGKGVIDLRLGILPAVAL